MNLLRISRSSLPLSYRDVQCEPTSSEISYPDETARRDFERAVSIDDDGTFFLFFNEEIRDTKPVLKRSRDTRFLTLSVPRVEKQPRPSKTCLKATERYSTLQPHFDSSGSQKFPATVLREYSTLRHARK